MLVCMLLCDSTKYASRTASVLGAGRAGQAISHRSSRRPSCCARSSRKAACVLRAKRAGQATSRCVPAAGPAAPPGLAAAPAALAAAPAALAAAQPLHPAPSSSPPQPLGHHPGCAPAGAAAGTAGTGAVKKSKTPSMKSMRCFSGMTPRWGKIRRNPR